MQRAEPYLSLVVTARNDDHGGDLLKRMQAFTDGWIEQSNRFSLESELIIVEWNIVSGRPSLAQALHWPAENRFCTIRILTIPPEVHGRYRHAESLGLYQMIAKNVGIRRARGEFVLATNIDILFSDELMEKLARRDLSRAKMYRIDRHDAMGEIPEKAGIEERLRWCKSHLLRVNAREGTFLVSPEGQRVPVERDIADRDSGIVFENRWCAPEIYEGKPYRWLGAQASLRLAPPPGTVKAELSIELEPGAGTGYGPLLLVALDGKGNRLAEHYVGRREVVPVPVPVEPGESALLTLHVIGGGRQVHNDPRLLNARVLSVGWSKRSALFDQAKWWLRRIYRRWKGLEHAPLAARERQAEEERTGLRYGSGWGPWERLGLGYARWIRGAGELILTSESGWGALELDMEVGPDAAGEKVRLVVTDEQGNEIASAGLEGRQNFLWRMGGEQQRVRKVRLRAERAGRPAAEADRIVLMHSLAWRASAEAPERAHGLHEEKRPNAPLHLHTNGCGDFTLLSREAWFDLRGYPEFDAFSMNIDSVLCWAAHHAGFHEEMLGEPMRIYHIEHGQGSGWTPEGEAQLYERIAKKKIPWLEYPDVISWARDMNRFHSPFVFNLGNWGLAADEFPETEIR